MPQPSVQNISILRINNEGVTETNDSVAVEEPLEIRLLYGSGSQRRQDSVSITMRTPGHDAELAVGFLFTEGIIRNASEVDNSFSLACGEAKENTLTVALKENVAVDLRKLERHFYTTSSCGVCGKSSIEALRTVAAPSPVTDSISIPPDFFFELPSQLRQQQAIFASTGGLHAAALFDLSGKLLMLREDVGRHNALDKLIGRNFLDANTPLNQHILLLSGRASFELIQKAAAAGIKIVAAVGAPSSLAIELAREYHITLLGFLSNQRFNIYSGRERVIV